MTMVISMTCHSRRCQLPPDVGDTEAEHGFETLAAYDSNGDARITSADDVWLQLALWNDWNHDGHTAPAEVARLSETDIRGIKRHQLYYQGPLSTTPNVRPWSLHRNGHLGVAQWGGWVWSGDTNATWKTLEAQVAAGGRRHQPLVEPGAVLGLRHRGLLHHLRADRRGVRALVPVLGLHAVVALPRPHLAAAPTRLQRRVALALEESHVAQPPAPGPASARSTCRPATGTTGGRMSATPGAAASAARSTWRRCRSTRARARSFRSIPCVTTSRRCGPPWSPAPALRAHVSFVPNDTVKAHWSNEVDDLVFWIDAPEGWQLERRVVTVPGVHTAT